MKKYWGIILLIILLCYISMAYAANNPGDPFELIIENNVVTGYSGDPREAPDNLVIPDGVTKIGMQALINKYVWGAGIFSPTFKTISFPDTLVEIDLLAFDGCPNLKELVFPSSLQKIRHEAFRNCPQLISIVFTGGKHLTCYGSFKECASLSSITFHNDLRELEISYAFENCHSLKSIVFPDSIKKLSANYAFEGCSNLTSVAIPPALESIEWYGMYTGCKSLSSCIIPPNATYIPDEAFKECEGLTVINNTSIKTIGNNAFQGCTHLSNIYLPNVDTIWKGTFTDCTELQTVTLNESGVISVGDNSFENCKKLKHLNRPLLEIGKEAFMGSGIQEITIQPDATIGYDAFDQTNVKIRGYKNSRAESYAEEYGHPFTIITIPMEITAIPKTDNLFIYFSYAEKENSYISSYNLQINYNNKPVTSIYYYSGESSNEHSFYLDDPLEIGKTYKFTVHAIYTLEDGNTVELGSTAFTYKYTGEAYLPSSFTDNTGTYAISKSKATFNKPADKNAKTLTIPSKIIVNEQSIPVVAISNNACKGMGYLTSVSIGKNVAKVGKNAFQNCIKLKTIKGGNGLVTIDAAAFKGCKVLTAITLNNKVKTIGKEAFSECKKLNTITIKTTLLTDKSVGKNAFKGIASKPTVKCPKAKLAEYKKMLVKKGVPKKAKFK